MQHQHTKKSRGSLRSRAALKPSIISVVSTNKPQKAAVATTNQKSPTKLTNESKNQNQIQSTKTEVKDADTLLDIFVPQEFIRQNGTRNSYDIHIIKKLIGKKILMPAKELLLTNKIRDEAKKVKLLLLDTMNPPKANQKNIIIHVVCNNGTMFVIGGYHNYMALNTISYKDIELNNHLKIIEIKLIQLPKVSNNELRQLIEYLG